MTPLPPNVVNPNLLSCVVSLPSIQHTILGELYYTRRDELPEGSRIATAVRIANHCGIATELRHKFEKVKSELS